MLAVDRIDTEDRRAVKRFVDFAYHHYEDHPQWVPPPRMDIRTMLDREKHPFYEHSDAAFFVVVRDGQDVGRIAVMENRRFNDYHDTRKAQFYLFECEDDEESARALFERAFEWARARGLETVVGPKGFGPLDGYGILITGFEFRQMMTMMKYNYEYYPRLMQALGFEKEVDFVSCHLDAEAFQLPERVHRIAGRVKERGTLGVKRFKSKRELRSWAGRIGEAYNAAFVDNWEYYPLTQHEVDFVVDNILTVADHRLIKVITHGEDIVGFLFGFPDVSAALKRANGRLMPWSLLDLLLEMRRTKRIALNGAGILPNFQGIGGNALLYTEMEHTIQDYDFEEAFLIQVAETAVQMRHDLENLGGRMYQNHRVYHRDI
ncbi:MAG: hypothetical protein ACP5GX_10285 [Anaerolineae bacterium]